jgi:hypothetical protein
MRSCLSGCIEFSCPFPHLFGEKYRISDAGLSPHPMKAPTQFSLQTRLPRTT